MDWEYEKSRCAFDDDGKLKGPVFCTLKPAPVQSTEELAQAYAENILELDKRYAAVVEAARIAIKEFDLWDLVEALRELDEHKGQPHAED